MAEIDNDKKIVSVSQLERLAIAINERHEEDTGYLLDIADGLLNLKAEKEDLARVEGMLGGRSLRYVTQEEYNALSNEEKEDDTIAWIIMSEGSSLEPGGSMDLGELEMELFEIKADIIELDEYKLEVEDLPCYDTRVMRNKIYTFNGDPTGKEIIGEMYVKVSDDEFTVDDIKQINKITITLVMNNEETVEEVNVSNLPLMPGDGGEPAIASLGEFGVIALKDATIYGMSFTKGIYLASVSSMNAYTKELKFDLLAGDYKPAAASLLINSPGRYTEGQTVDIQGNGTKVQCQEKAEIFNSDDNIAYGAYSHAEGYHTIASGEHQHVQGRFNVVDTANQYAHIVGNGAVEAKSNAHTLDWNGNAWFAGKVTAEGTPANANDLVNKAYVDTVLSSLVNVTTVSEASNEISEYTVQNVEVIADKILNTRAYNGLVMAAISDLHTTGNDNSADSIKHACQAINEINKITQLDLIVNLGDTIIDDSNTEGFKFIRKHMDDVSKSVPTLYLQGDRDNNITGIDARQKCFAYIGANNKDVVTDFNNRFRNYGYKDLDDLRYRVIYLNTTDTADEAITSNVRVSPEQFNWFINTALDFTEKQEPETWHIVILTHVPLDIQVESIQALLTILEAMKTKASGSILIENQTINYDFGSLAQNLVCHMHGHTHNFRTDWFDDLLSITIPNTCENSAFNVVVIDSRVSNKIYAYNYGTGVDRIIDLTTKEITDTI